MHMYYYMSGYNQATLVLLGNSHFVIFDNLLSNNFTTILASHILVVALLQKIFVLCGNITLKHKSSKGKKE